MEITKLKRLSGHKLKLTFSTGKTKTIDLENYLKNNPNCLIRSFYDEELFRTVHIYNGNLSFVGNELDLSASSLYNWQENQPEVISIAQYASKINKTRQAVLYQIKQKRLPKNVSATKIGHTYFLTVK